MPYLVRDIHGTAIKQRNQSSVMVAGKATKQIKAVIFKCARQTLLL